MVGSFDSYGSIGVARPHTVRALLGEHDRTDVRAPAAILPHFEAISGFGFARDLSWITARNVVGGVLFVAGAY